MFGTQDGSVSMVSVPANPKEMTLNAKRIIDLQSAVSCVKIPNEGIAICGNSDGEIYVVDLVSGKSVRDFQAHNMAINDMLIHRDQFFTCSSDDLVRQWNISNCSVMKVFVGHCIYFCLNFSETQYLNQLIL